MKFMFFVGKDEQRERVVQRIYFICGTTESLSRKTKKNE